jgi:hypothetical protein
MRSQLVNRHDTTQSPTPQQQEVIQDYLHGLTSGNESDYWEPPPDATPLPAGLWLQQFDEAVRCLEKEENANE